METTTIGNKIARARKKTNLSQAQLAESVFVTPQAVGKWERGESMPDIITLNRLAVILGVDLNYFSDGLESASAPAAPLEREEEQPAQLPAAKQKNQPGWDMSRWNWADADFSGLKNLHEKFSSSNMQRCLFVGSNLSGLLLNNNNVNSCDFTDSDISSSRIQRSNLTGNVFRNCSLNGTEFSRSNIGSCDFSGADLTGSTFRACNFSHNTITNARLNGVSFIEMALQDITFEGALEDCLFENCGFHKVTFQNCRITNTFFKNRSLKRIQFINCEADRMTYEFLRNGKADLSGVRMING